MSQKLKVRIVVSLFLLTSVMGLFFNANNVIAQNGGNSLTFDVEYSLHEFSNFSRLQTSTNHLNISLPSTKWNITNLELNFTDIKLGEEIHSIEEGGSGFKSIFKGSKGYGVQLNITEDITLLGVYIYGYLDSTTISPLDVQINGYDQVNNWPNTTVYGEPVPINISSIPNWYVQKFPEPIFLSKGFYYLVVNGSAYVPSDNSKHNWFLNRDDSIHTNLYTSKYSSGSWNIEAQGKPFRHKLIQRTEQMFNPETINMTLEVDGSFYNITNSSPGSGKAELSNISLPLNQTDLIFPVHHNQSIEIIFNVSYNLELENYLTSLGTIEVAETNDNYWSVTPKITPEFLNYSVKFKLPQKWSEVSVLRNEINITSLVNVNYPEKYIFISSNLISEGDTWEITASSSKIDFSLDVSRTEFSVGQELKFFIAAPIMEGSYTFVLIDTFNDQINSTTKLMPPESNSFTYTIPSNSLDGTYKAFVYWFNGTDTGLATQVFTITLPLTIDWFMITSIIIIIGLTSAVSASSYMVIKKNKKKNIARQEAINDKCIDILNLNYVLIIEKNSSLSVYNQVFTEKKMNTVLLSGFLEAIRTFGIELTGSKDHSQIIKLDYHNSKILMAEFKNFRLILIMKELPSESFYDSISALSLEIEEKYGSYLETFKGELGPFKTIEEVLKKHLGTTFLYPLKVVEEDKAKINTNERTMIDNALNIMKKNKNKYCYTTQLMQDKGYKLKDLETIFSLIDKKIFQPYV